MYLINHPSHIDKLPKSPIRQYIQRRFRQYTENPEEVPPLFILIEDQRDLSSENLKIFGSAGICSDVFDSHTIRNSGFQTIFDWISYRPDLNLYEMMYIEGDLGYWVMCPEEIVIAVPDLNYMISSLELSDPQPLF